MKAELRVFDGGEDIWPVLANRWRDAADSSVAGRGSFTAALSGGGTPRSFYLHLSREKGLPWSRTACFQVDERFLPPGHEESNGRMIRTALLGGGVPREALRLVKTGFSTPAEAADSYESEMRSYFADRSGGRPVFDFVLLGIGEDGHTASLFPGDPDLEDERRWVKAVTPASAPHDRITLTLPVLNAAREVVFLATGAGKAEALKTVMAEPSPDMPASLVSPVTGRLSFFADREAASRLPAPGEGPRT